jgi:hypothetical protein
MSTKEKAIKALENITEARNLFNEALSELGRTTGNEYTQMDIDFNTALYSASDTLKNLIGHIIGEEVEESINGNAGHE